MTSSELISLFESGIKVTKEHHAQVAAMASVRTKENIWFCLSDGICQVWHDFDKLAIVKPADIGSSLLVFCRGDFANNIQAIVDVGCKRAAEFLRRVDSCEQFKDCEAA